MQLIERRACLQRGHGFDKVSNRFRLHQIDPAIEKGSQRELSRLGQPCPCGHGGRDDCVEHNRAPVRAQLHNIIACV